MSANDVIADDMVVSIHYTLTLDGGETVDSSVGHEPLLYLHGAQNIVPGLESELTGRKVGDAFDVAVAPAEGYGERMEGVEQQVPVAMMPEGVELDVGMPLSAHGPDGQVMTVWVTAVGEEQVTIDPNHPLAGKTLNFAIEVISMRAATEEELAHGHPHGPGGHHHH